MRFLAIAALLGAGQAIASASCPTTNLQVAHSGTPVGEIRTISGGVIYVADGYMIEADDSSRDVCYQRARQEG
jgi:hypothetical protein